MIWRVFGLFDTPKISLQMYRLLFFFLFFFSYTVHIYNDDDYDCGSCSMKIGSQKFLGSDKSRNSPNSVSISANPSSCRSSGAGSESRAISGSAGGEIPLSIRCLLAGMESSVGSTCPVSTALWRAPPRDSGCDLVVGWPCIWWRAFWPSLAMASAEYQYGLICSSREQQASRLAFARSRCVMSLLERSWRYETPIERVTE